MSVWASFKNRERNVLRIDFDASNRDDQKAFHVLYYSVSNGGPRDASGRGLPRSHDVRERERSLIAKLKACSALDPVADPDNLRWDLPEPRVLVTSTLLLTPSERDMAAAYVKDTGWPPHFSDAWLDLQKRLADAEKALPAEQAEASKP